MDANVGIISLVMALDPESYMSIRDNLFLHAIALKLLRQKGVLDYKVPTVTWQVLNVHAVFFQLTIAC